MSSAPQFYPTESPRTQLRVVHSDHAAPAQVPLSAAERERIVAEQRAANAWAIKQSHREGVLHKFASAALRTAPPTRTVEFWQGDAAALRRALIALGDITLLIQVLIDAGAITDVAADVLDDRLHIVRLALERFT